MENGREEGVVVGRRFGTRLKGEAPEYTVWATMKRRCFNPNTTKFGIYGARGITVSPRWLGEDGFSNFIADMGPRPSPKHSIDRINNGGNYEPGNCRWATAKEQANNRRPRRKVAA